MFKKSLLFLFVLPLLVGCNQNPSSPSSSSSSEDISSSSSSEEGQSSSSSTRIEKTITYQFLGDSSRTYLNGGSNLNNVNPHNAFLSILNAEQEVVSSFTSESCFFQNYNNENKTTLTIGSSSSGGSLTINFLYEIKSITASVQAYCKYIEYNSTYSIDTTSALNINGEITDLSVSDTSKIPETKNVNLSLKESTRSLTFSTANGKSRVFINSLSLTYYEN